MVRRSISVLPAGSVADEAEPRIRELLAAYPRMPATVIAERIGWSYSIRTLSERVRELRPVYLPPDPASRTTYLAGEIAQCDFWFPDVVVPVGFGQVRTATAAAGVDDGVWVFAVGLGGVDPDTYRRGPVCRVGGNIFRRWAPRRGCWCGTAKARSGGGGHANPNSPRQCQAFRGTLAAKVLICKPGDPEAKGLVERFHDYLERAFLPGRVFSSPADFNTQLQDWLVRANHRQHRVLGCRPADRIEADKAAMLTLPPVGPSIGWRTSTRLPRDHYVRLRRQRLLGAPGRGRSAHRDHRRPGPGPGVVWRRPGRRPCPGLGQTSDDQ